MWRRAMALLLLGVLGSLAGCQEDAKGGRTEGPDGSGGRPAEVVHAPPAPGNAGHCEKVAEGDPSATSGGVVAGPFDGLAGAARHNGVAKFWVAPATEPSVREDAVIQVEITKGPVHADPALYVRRGEDMVAVTSGPERGVNKIYNGTIVVPSAEGTTIRITVTIGDSTGCFLTRL